jgi:hypothetical protein
MSNIVQGQTTTFKKNLLQGLENFAVGTSYTYKIALYTGNAILNQSTATYITENEVSGTGYTAGGKTLSVIPPQSDDLSSTAYLSFLPVTWAGASFTTRCALIYNSTTNASVCVLDFGSDKTTTQAGTFTVTFPTPTATNAIIRIS